jgi:hypothetical protein
MEHPSIPLLNEVVKVAAESCNELREQRPILMLHVSVAGFWDSYVKAHDLATSLGIVLFGVSKAMINEICDECRKRGAEVIVTCDDESLRQNLLDFRELRKLIAQIQKDNRGETDSV